MSSTSRFAPYRPGISLANDNSLNSNGASTGRAINDYDPYGESYGSSRLAPPMNSLQTPVVSGASMNATDQYSNPAPLMLYQSRRPQQRPPPVEREAREATHAERQITQVLELIKRDWPAMCQDDCIPVQLALQLLDSSSVGRAHEYQNFQKTHQYLQDSLKNIVHDYHQGFNSSIGTFHKIQGSIQASQQKVRALKESLAASKSSLCTADLELKKLYITSHMYDEVIHALNELEELRLVPDQLEARISEKRFLTAVDVLHAALRRLRKPELDKIGALSDLRAYLANQETVLMDTLVEELHEHLYLKSPYCQERWQALAKCQTVNEALSDAAGVPPFYAILDGIDFDKPAMEDPSKNPEADTFHYVSMLVESLNKLGRLEIAVETLRQRLPVELFAVVTETINDIDEKHPSSLRGGMSGGLYVYGDRKTQMRADVIHDLLWTLYGKFEAIAEGHRVFHEYTKALIRREGAGNNSTLLGGFKELWNLYQNEIRSLLHNYVTTDADVYRSNASFSDGRPAAAAKESLFKFSEADSKSTAIVTGMEALDGIIRANIPGLTTHLRKGGDAKKVATHDMLNLRKRSGQSYENQRLNSGAGTHHKPLVEASVFNMSLLLPPTLVFLQRLKNIVPPGSDLATSTLATFLDNFLVNVFQPQLDETLAKLSESIFSEADAFKQDPNWTQVAKRPIFKGASAFFTVVAAFCRMLSALPQDQAVSALITTQMQRYYERCQTWYSTLVAKTHDESSSTPSLRASASMARGPGDIHETLQKLWRSERQEPADLEKEVGLLILYASEKNLQSDDIIQDREAISSLCLLYTSMKWLAIKIASLRQITNTATESLGPGLTKAQSKRWSLLQHSKKAGADDGPVRLLMTHETVQTFDGIVSSYEGLASTTLLTLHVEIRCRILQTLRIALSPETAPYILEQAVGQPDPQILSLNAELIAYDGIVSSFLRDRETAFVRTGLGLLVTNYLVAKAATASPMNANGCGRMKLNILVLQQNLKNVEDGVNLARAANYFALFDKGPAAIVEKAKADSAQLASDGNATTKSRADCFTYEELKTMVELCYSEQMTNSERGIAAQAMRQMSDTLLTLSEHTWQSS